MSPAMAERVLSMANLLQEGEGWAARSEAPARAARVGLGTAVAESRARIGLLAELCRCANGRAGGFGLTRCRSRGGIRTRDLLGMSQASYRAAPLCREPRAGRARSGRWDERAAETRTRSEPVAHSSRTLETTADVACQAPDTRAIRRGRSRRGHPAPRRDVDEWQRVAGSSGTRNASHPEPSASRVGPPPTSQRSRTR